MSAHEPPEPDDPESFVAEVPGINQPAFFAGAPNEERPTSGAGRSMQAMLDQCASISLTISFAFSDDG